MEEAILRAILDKLEATIRDALDPQLSREQVVGKLKTMARIIKYSKPLTDPTQMT